MKKPLFLSIGLTALIAQTSSAQLQTNLINSWENSLEGWGTDGTIWTSGGFSTSSGVTAGTYSWILNASTNGNYSFAAGGTATTALTAMLANAVAVQIDVLTPGASFGFFQQWTLTLNQNGGLGYQSVDSYSFSQSPVIGTETTLTWSIPAGFQSTLAANPGLATSLNFQIGSGYTDGNMTMYLDNLRIVVPEPTTVALFGLGALGLLKFARRRL